MNPRSHRFEWIRTTRNFTCAQKGLLFILLHYLQDKRECWPTNATLASDARTSEKTVARHLKAFQARGLLFVTYGPRPRSKTSGRILHFRFPGEEARITAGPDKTTGTAPDNKAPGADKHAILSTASGHPVPSLPDIPSCDNRSGCPTEKVLELKDPESKKIKKNQVPVLSPESRRTERPQQTSAATAPASSALPAPAPLVNACEDPLAPTVLELFDRICTGLQTPETLTPEARDAIARMTRSYAQARFPGWWQAYFQRIAESKFLNGGGQRDWHAPWEWILQPWTARQILAGRYDNDIPAPGSGKGQSKTGRNLR